MQGWRGLFLFLFCFTGQVGKYLDFLCTVIVVLEKLIKTIILSIILILSFILTPQLCEEAESRLRKFSESTDPSTFEIYLSFKGISKMAKYVNKK